jgi:DNA-binding transcriptional LysR family regulator
VELTHLRYFLAIADAGSMSAAAKRLRVSQPTLSSAIAQLEKQLSTTLFVRDHSGVTLTGTGEELQRHALQVFTLIEQAGERISSLETGSEGRFVIGCHESLGAYFLPGFMSSFLKAEPRISVLLHNASSSQVQQAVVERKVHFGLVVNPPPHPDLVIVDMFRDAVDLFVADPVAASPLSWPEACRRIETSPLIYASRIFQCLEIIERLTAHKVAPRHLLSCGDLELVKSLTLADVGVGLLPRRVAAYGQQGRLHRLHPELPFFPDTICLLFRGDLHRTSGALRLKEALLSHGKALDQLGDGFDPHGRGGTLG